MNNVKLGYKINLNSDKHEISIYMDPIIYFWLKLGKYYDTNYEVCISEKNEQTFKFSCIPRNGTVREYHRHSFEFGKYQKIFILTDKYQFDKIMKCLLSFEIGLKTIRQQFLENTGILKIEKSRITYGLTIEKPGYIFIDYGTYNSLPYEDEDVILDKDDATQIIQIIVSEKIKITFGKNEHFGYYRLDNKNKELMEVFIKNLYKITHTFNKINENNPPEKIDFLLV